MKKTLASFALALSCLASPVTGVMAQNVPPNVVKELAPNGKLRAAINFGNIVLAQKDPRRRAARRLGGPRARTGQAARRADRIRHLRRRRQGVRRAQGGSLGHRLPGHRSGARAKASNSPAPYVVIEGAYSCRGLAAEDERGRRPRRRAHRGRPRQRLRPVPHARDQDAPIGARADRPAALEMFLPRTARCRGRREAAARRCSPRTIRMCACCPAASW